MSTTTQRTRSPGLSRVRFGEYLVERRVITDGELLDALADHWANGGRLGDVLVRNGAVSRDEVERLAEEFDGLRVVYV